MNYSKECKQSGTTKNSMRRKSWAVWLGREERNTTTFSANTEQDMMEFQHCPQHLQKSKQTQQTAVSPIFLGL